MLQIFEHTTLEKIVFFTQSSSLLKSIVNFSSLSNFSFENYVTKPILFEIIFKYFNEMKLFTFSTEILSSAVAALPLPLQFLKKSSGATYSLVKDSGNTNLKRFI